MGLNQFIRPNFALSLPFGLSPNMPNLHYRGIRGLYAPMYILLGMFRNNTDKGCMYVSGKTHVACTGR